MNRRQFLGVSATTAAAITNGLRAEPPASAPAAGTSSRGEPKLLGLYMHQHWTYNRPYAVRSWTDEDWRSFLGGLARLGYNFFMTWPLLEIMPNPPTPSDRAKLEQMGRVIDMAHDEFNMKAWMVLCPNNSPIDAYARRMPYAKRSFFGSDDRINPADPKALAALMARRETLLKPLAKMDALVIIDSDPGGYPGSVNADFVNLLVQHRRVLDKLRPGGIELVYWVNWGWQAYSRAHATGNFDHIDPTDEEFIDTLQQIQKAAPEPWGVANGLKFAEKLGLQSRVMGFNYGRIEGEPSFPMTNFGGTAAYDSAKEAAPRGVMGNAQTHGCQLPGIFAFARGAQGLPLTDADYVKFADDLIPGKGATIVEAWKAIGGPDPKPMREMADQMAALAKSKPEAGPLKGLLFGDPVRFARDLTKMLRCKAAALEFVAASQRNEPIRAPFAEFVARLEEWQLTTGYNAWWSGIPGVDVNPALRKLNAPALNAFYADGGFPRNGEGDTAPLRVESALYMAETETLRLIRAARQTYYEMVE